MNLDTAIDVHIQRILKESTLGDSRELVQVGPIRVIRDAPGRKRDSRNEQFVISGVDPQIAMEAVRQYNPARWFLAVVEGPDADHDNLKAQYKAGAYRLLIRYPLFAFDLAKGVPSYSELLAKRVTTADQADAVTRAAGKKQITPQFVHGGDADYRLYASISHGRAKGWVQSIRATSESQWVSNLHVLEADRRQGIGFALMARMLGDDLRYGAKHSVLLASNEGSKLYQRLGYEQVGLMQIFSPVKSR